MILKISKMKKITGFSILLLVFLLAASNPLSAQRGMRGMMSDSLRMNRMRIDHDSVNSRFIHPNMPPMMRGPMWNSPGRWGMNQMWRNPWQRGMGPQWFGPYGRRMDPGMNFGMRRPGMGRGSDTMKDIPNLTEKQKSALDELRQQNQAEMKKFREETGSKLKSLRDDHRQKILDILTPDQKKWFESHNPPSESR
jgi:hypothetical protein